MREQCVFFDNDTKSETFGKWCARFGSFSIDGFETEAEAQAELQAMIESETE